MKRIFMAANLLAGLAGCSPCVELTQQQTVVAAELRTAPPGTILVSDSQHIPKNFQIVCGSSAGRIQTAVVGPNSNPCSPPLNEFNSHPAEQIVYSSRVVRVVEPTDPEYDGLVESLVMDLADVNRRQR